MSTVKNAAAAGQSQAKVRLVWAGASLSALVLTDLLLKLFCASWPLVLYIVFGAAGAGCGSWIHRRFSGESLVARFIQRGARFLALFSVVGLVVLVVMPVAWETKCAWRFCGRALGPGLFLSPFPVGTPACGDWGRCVNEYSYTDREYTEVLHRMQNQGCAAP